MGALSHCRTYGPIVAGACLLLVAAPAGAAAAQISLGDKPIRFITMGAVGGGYDAYMRTILSHLEKQTGATITPVNESAAGGLLAMNRMLNAPPDGTAILLTS